MSRLHIDIYVQLKYMFEDISHNIKIFYFLFFIKIMKKGPGILVKNKICLCLYVNNQHPKYSI